MSDHETAGNGGVDDDLSLPKATVQKLIAEMLPSDIVCARDTRDLLIDCCVEFIHLIASEANEICEKETKKTIAAEHVLSALRTLGFESYLDEVQDVYKEHKKMQKDRERKSSRLENSGMTEEELLRQQELLFEQSRQKYQSKFEMSFISSVSAMKSQQPSRKPTIKGRANVRGVLKKTSTESRQAKRVRFVGINNGDTEDEEETKEKRKKHVKERTETYNESEYNLSTRNAQTNVKKLNLQDLVGTIQNEAGFTGLKKSLLMFENSDKKGAIKGPLAAPLPKRIKDRLNREAAYEQTKKDISKWETIVKENRKKEHLEFPMNAQPSHQISTSQLVSSFKATTPLEKQIEKALVESGVEEKNLQKYEELQLNKLSVDEVLARQRELRRMRELAFRAEIKAKRIAKIKSKAYRKIRKKEREKNQFLLEQFTEPDDDITQQKKLKLETARAEERMTLKHKNSSKWAKQALKHGRNNQESRQAIVEQLQRHEALTRKIHGIGSEDEESEDEYSDIEDGDVEAVRKRALEELEQIEEDVIREPVKGVFAMKFMTEAAKRQEEQAMSALDDLRRSLENEEISDVDGDNDKKEEKQKSTVIKVGGNPGRMIFRTNVEGADQANDNSIINNVVEEVDVFTQIDKSQGKNFAQIITSFESIETNSKSDNDEAEEESNPWLQTDTSKVATSSKKSNKGLGKDSNKYDKMVTKLKRKSREEKEEDVEIDMDNVLTMEPPKEKEKDSAKKKKKRKKRKTKKQQGNNQDTQTSENANGNINTTNIGEDESNEDDEKEDDEKEDDDGISKSLHIVHVKSATAFTQRELVARAFANDDVVKEFEADKLATIDEEEPKGKNVTLPGWGTWGGKGVKPSKKPPIILKPLPGEGVQASKRKDAKLKHVIINEKRVKKATRYLATKVPYPFETREQYEASLRAPIGREWNTQEVYQKMIKPRVITKMGTIIDPLTAKFRDDDGDSD
ncbi:2819_t:CDS:10 [Paraglomus brasilianum]|uniref:2819_t:CDS:1 n=1 Tax=Paraglomus brasilianum TaxID=144538 RepID=A0A9N9CN42_9GLOM|nr:2819_t:CDS:10 [Paraglomus brasilianum]